MMHPSLLAGVAGVAAGLLSLTPMPFAAPLPIFLIGLSSGWTGAAISAAIATVLVALVAGTSLAAMFALTQGGPPVLLVRQALLSRSGPNGTEWYPVGTLLAWLSACAALVVPAVVLLFPDHIAALQSKFEVQYGNPIQTMLEGLTAQEIDMVKAEVISWLFALAVIGSMVVVALNGAAAQGLLVRLKKNIRPAGSFSSNGLDLPLWLLAALAITAVAVSFWQTDATLGKVWLAVFALPFAFHSIFRTHWLLRNSPVRLFALVAFYILVLVFSLWGLMALAVWGIVEQLVRTWRQMNGANTGQEKE